MKIASEFGIVKKGSTEVFDNQIKSDGYVISEIESALNIDALQRWTGQHSSDMLVLWDAMISKIEGREIIRRKRGRPRKNP